MKKKILGYVAMALACMMLGSAVTMVLPQAQADTVVVTSPFTSAVNLVRESVVGVSNYRMVRVNNSGSNGYYGNGFDPFSFFGFGNYGFGNYGYGNYGGNNQEPQSEEVEYATGSGVVVAPEYVLTNYHVVENASALKITISADNADEAKTMDAELVACDESLDVAVLHVTGLELPAVELGDSDSLQVGDWAICIGNPLSKKFAGTVTAGIVSGLDRAIDTDTTTDKYGRKTKVTNSMIQVDAAINSGNSGGGMFNVLGQLMGIPTLKYSSSYSSSASIESIGMCIPINAAKPLIEEAVSGKGKLTINSENETASSASSGENNLNGKPRMGVTVGGLNANNSSAVRNGILPQGVLVKEIQENSPAAAAGMKVSDIIVEIDETVITGVSQMQKLVASHEEGDTIRVKVFRAEDGLDLINGKIPQNLKGDYVDLELVLAIVDDVVQ